MSASPEVVEMNDVRKVLATIQENTNKLLEHNRPLRQQYTDLHDSLNFHIAKIEKLVKENQAMKKEVKSLKTSLERAQEDNEVMVEDLATAINHIEDLEQYSRKHNLEIHGVPESAEENTVDIIIKFGNVLNVPIWSIDIDICHRLSTNRDLTKGRRERRRRRWPEENPHYALQSALVSSRSAQSARTWKSYICRPVENVSVFASIWLENVTVNAFLTIFWPFEIIDNPEILFLRVFFRLNLAASRWSGHTITTLFLLAKYSTRRHGFTGMVQRRKERFGQRLPTIWMPWKNQALKSHRGQLETGIHTWKKPQDQSRTRGASKWDLPRRVWSWSGDEEIIQLFEEHDWENEKLSEEKKKKAEEDVTKAEEMRGQSLETFKETQRRKESEKPPKKKRASGSDTMSYLKEISEVESNRRAEELELRRKETEIQNELQREELKMRRQELDDKRNQNEAIHQQMMMQQQQLQLLMQQQQQQSTVMIALLEKALAAKK